MSKSQLQHKKSIENSKILVNCSQKWMLQKYMDVVSLVGMTTPDFNPYYLGKKSGGDSNWMSCPLNANLLIFFE